MTMSAKHTKRVVLVWLVLVLLTFVSWGFAREQDGLRITGPDVAMAIVLAVAFAKTQLIGSVFMELRTAPVPLRLAFSAWVLGVGGVIVSMYLWL
jgi:Prokaryotic Cytochrome C oxidase subunit IV